MLLLAAPESTQEQDAHLKHNGHNYSETKLDNKLRKTVLTNREEWIDACKNVTNMVREHKKAQWKEYVGTLNMSTNPMQVRRTMHSLDGKYPAKSENEVLTVNGVALVDDTARANAFGKTYRQFSRLP